MFRQSFANGMHHFSSSVDQPLMTMLKSLSPSSVDAELRGLAPEAGGTVELLAAMLQFLTFQLRTRRDYELTQAYINVLLKVVHSGTLSCIFVRFEMSFAIFFTYKPSTYVPPSIVCLHVHTMCC